MRGRPYEPHEVDYIINHYHHMTASELGLQLNRSRGAIQILIAKLRREGRLDTNRKGYTAEEIQYISEHIGHKPISQIAEYLGKTVGSVSAKVYKMRRQGQLKESNYKPYTENELSYITNLYGFLTAKELAAKLGRTIKAIELTVGRLKEKENNYQEERLK